MAGVKYNGDVLQLGRDVMQHEADELIAAASALGDSFVHSVECMLACKGRIVVTGVGKSGHIARKIAATLASTGTPAFFVHAGEAGHGDLGMITNGDLLIAISNSGETDEVINFVSFAKRFGVTIIGMTGSSASRVGRLSDWHIDAGVRSEACPIGVAPTSSTTLQLAIGDALAMAVLAKRGFTAEDFARTHPFGALGRRFYLRVKDVMQPIKDIPHRPASVMLKAAIPEMALGRVGAILLLDGETLKGIFTDSDLRRVISQSQGHFDEKLNLPVSEFMTKNPMTIDASMLASDALRIFEEKRISRLVCVDGARAVGLLAWHNLLQHKVA
jgi:arabinose-5-phosphate isomerase